jgi:hypothetical protein
VYEQPSIPNVGISEERKTFPLLVGKNRTKIKINSTNSKKQLIFHQFSIRLVLEGCPTNNFERTQNVEAKIN